MAIDVNKSILVSIHNCATNQTHNLIVEPFNFHIKYKEPMVRVLLGFNYEHIPVGTICNFAVNLTDDPDCHYAWSSGSLGYWNIRLNMTSAVLQCNSPLMFEGFMENMERKINAVLR